MKIIQIFACVFISLAADVVAFNMVFTFDDQINDGDLTIENQNVGLVVDPMSLQYLIGGTVDYVEGLEGSRFIVNNPNASSTCGCGSSFSV